MSRASNRVWLIALCAVLAAVAVPCAPGCGARDADTGCAQPAIMPHLSPVNFGDLNPAPADGSTPAALTVPYEWALVLLSKCSQPVAITKICIVGDNHNGVKGSKAFYTEGPEPKAAAPGVDPVVRITYSPKELNTDQNADGKPDPDNVALVVQSNALNFPTLVVPVCARLVAAGTAPAVFECTSPVTIAAGTKDETLCP